MNNSPAIRLLAASNNERGDLFTRLTKDLFFALGYDNLRLDVHKSGRELDLQGEHRFEPRRVVGECKAHAKKMGGDELNKFFGVLTRERKKYSSSSPVAGYFVSLSGFTETGVDQEMETGDDRVILLNSHEVVEELERCRVIVGRTEAAERAGQCAQRAGLGDSVLERVELLGHQRGYLWAVYYGSGKERTHFALIHADGTPLAETVALDVIEADRRSRGMLHSMQYLPPPSPAPDRIALAAQADARYRQWLAEECGYIHLDGLPADTDLSATRLKLELLFVPLKATFLPESDDHPDATQTLRDMVFSIGEVLEKAPHLALLAMPGGGKTTLLKRLATAYALPDRRGEVSDDLPLRDWLPLFLRCRELRDRAHRPIIEILDDIPRHAGMNADECAIFRDTVHAALRSGSVLLLVDGLDEISDEGARQTFASHLRTFVAMFPQAAVVVTSREAGFRLVAGVVASACEQAKLAALDEEDVLSLCERWHVEVVGDNAKVRVEAKELGRTIWENGRIRTLAENPLLLTTLLVVKRWVGELPRGRAALYREAIRVLVRTWNVEGYEPLDEDETLAQLSYVACAMMEDGKQRIGQRELLKLLQSARQELEAELQFARISPQAFIERIEYRSSLLMQTGYERIDGLLQPVYEFRHLTFQEYLSARGYVEEQYPGRESGSSLADLLESHFGDGGWLEVISLSAVLAGRKAEHLIERLVAAGSRSANNIEQAQLFEHSYRLLYQCIRDEVQVTAPTLRLALRELARGRYYDEPDSGWSIAIARGKFGAIFQEAVQQGYLAGVGEFEEFNGPMVRLAMYARFGDERPALSDNVAASLERELRSDDRLAKVNAALVCMEFAYERGSELSVKSEVWERVQPLSRAISLMLDCSDLPCALAASWALAWMGDRGLLAPDAETILSLYKLWRQEHSPGKARYFAWALTRQPLTPRDTFDKMVWGDCDSFLRQNADFEDWLNESYYAALLVGWYRRQPWSDLELVHLIERTFDSSAESIEPNYMGPMARRLLEHLGRAGRRVLEAWERVGTHREPVRGKRKAKTS